MLWKKLLWGLHLTHAPCLHVLHFGFFPFQNLTLLNDSTNFVLKEKSVFISVLTWICHNTIRDDLVYCVVKDFSNPCAHRKAAFSWCISSLCACLPATWTGPGLTLWFAVDLSKLRLSDSSNSGSDGTGYNELGSPELEDYPFLQGRPVMGPFCCATFPLARGLARTIKRLWNARDQKTFCFSD